MAVTNEFSEANMQEMKNVDSTVALHDISDQAGLIMKKKHFNCLCVYAQTLYVGTRNSKLYIYTFDGEKLTDEKVLIPHCQIVSSITATHKYFVSVPQSDDQTVVSIWSAPDRSFLTALKGHKSQVSKVIFLKDDGFIGTSSWDSTVKVWFLDQNMSNQEPHSNFQAGGYPILTLQEDSKRDILILGGDDCYLTFWNWKKNQTVGKVFGHAGSVTFIHSLSPYVLSGGGDNKFKLLRCQQKVVQQQLMMMEEGEEEPQPKQTYNIQIVTEIKKQYDPNLFQSKMDDGSLLLMDRQGNMFLYNKQSDESMKVAGNYFKYNESVTGLQRFGKFLFISTTKGEIKVFMYSLHK